VSLYNLKVEKQKKKGYIPLLLLLLEQQPNLRVTAVHAAPGGRLVRSTGKLGICNQML
jgi:hypothetical protein